MEISDCFFAIRGAYSYEKFISEKHFRIKPSDKKRRFDISENSMRAKCF